MDDSEARKKRLEELKQQSLDMERESAEREKRAEERRKQREEQLRQLQEQEKRDEEERQRKREERRKLREDEDRKLKEDMARLEEERKNRQLQRENGASVGTTTPPAVDDDDPELKKIREEREKRLEEKKKQREEAQKMIELEEQRIAEDRERRKEERRLQLEEEKKKLDDELKKKDEQKAAAAKEEEEKAAKEEADRLEKEKAAKEEADRLEKEKAAKEEADRLEKEKAAKEEADKLEKEKAVKAEQDRLEKERLAKEEADRLEKEKAAKEEADRLEKEKAAKEESDRLEKERLAKEEADRLEKEKAAKEEADRLEKERLAKEESDRLEKEKAAKEEADRLEKEKAAKAETERLEKERLAKEEANRLEKEKASKEEADRLEKEKAAKAEAERLEKEKAEADRLEKERLAKEEADRLEKEKLAKEESDRLEKERLAKEEADRLEKERLAKEESDRLEKQRLAKEEADLLEKKRLAKEESDRLEKERLAKEEADRLEKEKAAKEEADRLEKERLAKEEANRLEKEKAAKEEADRLEKERLAKEEADRLEKERLAKEESDRLEKEKAAKAEAERLEKEKAAKAEAERLEKEKAAKAEADRLEKEKAAKAETERLEKEKAAKAEAERLEKEKAAKAETERLEKEKAAKAEADRLEKEKAAKAETEKKPTNSITDAFKLTIEKQLKEQMENKNKPPVSTEESNDNTPQKLTNLTLERAKIKGRKLPSKNHKPPISSESTTNTMSSTPASGASLLAQAMESGNREEATAPKKKIVLPPGAAGLMGGMAALAAEAQKKKLEKDSKNALNRLKAEEPEAPQFVKGRSQSVSVTSTMKNDATGKFLVHKKVVDTYSGLRTRLIQCKGKKRILTREVEVSTRSLNKTDAFVLDCGIDNSGVGGESVDSAAHSNIYVWYGSKSNAAKKAKATAIAEIIKSHERGGHATIVKLDEGDKDSADFFKRINGKPDDMIMPDGGDDLEAEQTWPQSFILLKYDGDRNQFTSIDSKALSMELLASDSFFVLDTGTEFYAWSGRNADIPQYKDKFLEKAKERLQGNIQRPPWVEMIVTSEGGEPVMFREKYFDWPDLSHEVSLSRMGFGKKRVFDVSIPYEKKSPAKMSQFDIQEMVHSEPPEEAPQRSDGTGTYEMWYVENSKIHPIPQEEYGHFFSGNCYLIKYTYTRWNALRYIIYIWQGCDASRQDIGSSSLLSKDMYIETCNSGDCFQDCVRQGRENVQFTMVFNGRMVVHRGERGEFDYKSKRLYHLYGKRDNTIIASQCTKLSASCLNSRDVFVVTDSNTTYMWEGKGVSKSLKEQSSKLATLIVNSPSKSAATIQEGKEPDEFWKMLGGKSTYANYDQLTKQPQNVKLFAVVNTGSIIRADEVFNFNQYELQPSRVFILDNKVKMYVWSGSRATEKEKKRGMEIAIEYLNALNDGRKEEDVLFIKEKEEPVEFTCQFHSWDPFRFLNSNGADTDESPKVESASTLLKKYYQTLPFEALTQKNTPPEIDRSVLEMYLSDEEFQKILGMQKTEWEALPGWKKTERKKSVGLF